MTQFINNARFQNKVRDAYQVDENVVETAKDLVPGVVFENDRFEMRFPGNEFSFTAGLEVAAGGAGNSSNIALLNPTGSGVLIVVEWFNQGALSALGAVSESVITTNYTQNTTQLITRDFRGFGPAGQLWTRNNAVPPTERARFAAAGTHYIQFAIAPTQALVLWGVTLNAVFQGTVGWYEHALSTSTK